MQPSTIVDVFAVKQLEACVLPAALNVRDCSQRLDTSLSVPLEEEIIVSCHFLPGREQDFTVRRDNAAVTHFGAGCIFNPMTQEAYASTRELGNRGFFSFITQTELFTWLFPPPPTAVDVFLAGFPGTRVENKVLLFARNAWVKVSSAPKL